MNEEEKLNSERKCAEVCGCADEKETPQNKNQKISQEEIKLDPTHFGDWQVNCRAIDF